jgi:D-alanyl-D-alanine carboxypeptidase/D-alanyl-D-alanine-endopeptidase (penicillin-binding protein 4)
MKASRLHVAFATLATTACIGLSAPAALAAPSTHDRQPARTSSASSAQIALSARLSHELSAAGSQSGAYAYDLTTGTPLFAERAEIERPPASVEKLYTSTTALELMGPAATLSTSVLGVGHLGAGGVWDGSLYLRGGGDPTFGSSSFIDSHYYGQGASVSALAEQLIKTDGIRAVTGGVYGDESYLDSLRGEPSSNYQFDPFLEGVLSGLAFNRGETGTEKGPHAPAEYAALQLRGALRGAGDTIHGGGAATTPMGATLLATASSPPLATLLGLMLPPSDNYFAETLVKDLGARYGGGGTTAAGAAVVRATIASHFDIHPSVVDGSGLSRSDHTSPLQVVTLLSDLSHSPLGTTLRKDLAVAGESGTLSERMRGTPAAGHCQAKTGTLTGASNLAGYCQAANGNILAFAIFNDGIETGEAHLVQDNMAVTLARY